MRKRANQPVSSARQTVRRRELNEAESFLRRVVILELNDDTGHRWVRESDRWKELVFALLTRTAPLLVETNIRQLVERLHEMQVLNVPDLVSLCEKSSQPDFGDARARLIVDLLMEIQFTKEQAEKGLITICQAALGLNKHFNGKVQLFLRRYGEHMMRDCKRVFSFTSLKQSDINYAFTYWLQNVLSLPLPLVDENWKAVQAKHGINPADLISAADDLDLNIAVLDDLLKSYFTRPPTNSQESNGAELAKNQPMKAKVGKAHRGRKQAKGRM